VFREEQFGERVTRLLIVDDHAAFRQPLALLMNREPGFVVVAQAGTLGEARQKLDGVDIALIDRDLPDGDGASLAETLRARNPGTRVLLLTGFEISSQVPGVTTLDAQTLDKSAALSEILGTTRSLVAG
jgi:DNA-binding NarL/FixJ family response regulator